MNRITLLSSADALTGYGQHAIEIIRYFDQIGVYVSLRPLRVVDGAMGADLPTDIRARIVRCPQPEEWELLVGPPHHFPTPGKKTVYLTMWESTELPGKSVEFLNMAELVVVPCEWCRDTFIRCGVKKPVVVVPLGFDPEVFKYHPPIEDGVTKFITAGRTAHGRDRKGMDSVIRSFLAAFPYDQDVSLTVKCHKDCQLPDITDPRITVVRDHLTEQGVADLLVWHDCFVSGAAAEGWGLWQLQSMAMGRPVIAAIYGGLAEFMDEHNSYPIKFSEVDASENFGGKWAKPDESDMQLQMQRVRLFKGEVKRIGRRAKRNVRGLTWEQHCAGLSKLLPGVDSKPVAHQERLSLHSIWKQGLREIRSIARRKLSADADQNVIQKFYARQKPSFKNPVGDRFLDYALINTPIGLGDAMVLTGIPGADGSQTRIWAAYPKFEDLALFVPGYAPINRNQKMIGAAFLNANYDAGNGHFTQRLHRVFNLPVPKVPSGRLIVDGDRVKGRVALHFTPGVHAGWQKVHVHPRAREIYPETAAVIQQFVHQHPEMEFVEIGQRPSGIVAGVEDKTGMQIADTIRLLKTCDMFIGIMSGPLHIATALGCRCVVIINFPDPSKIFLPVLVNIRQEESEWFYPQHVHLHQEGEGEQVKQFSLRNLERAVAGEIYPYWSDRFLGMIHI